MERFPKHAVKVKVLFPFYVCSRINAVVNKTGIYCYFEIGVDLKLGFVNDGNTKKSVFSFLVTTVCFFPPRLLLASNRFENKSLNFVTSVNLNVFHSSFLGTLVISIEHPSALQSCESFHWTLCSLFQPLCCRFTPVLVIIVLLHDSGSAKLLVSYMWPLSLLNTLVGVHGQFKVLRSCGSRTNPNPHPSTTMHRLC